MPMPRQALQARKLYSYQRQLQVLLAQAAALDPEFKQQWDDTLIDAADAVRPVSA